MSGLDGNPKDRLSYDMADFILQHPMVQNALGRSLRDRGDAPMSHEYIRTS